MIYWHWIALGMGLMAIEILLPSFFFLWLGVAAIAVGAIVFIVPDMWWTYQCTLFAALGVGSFFISRLLFKQGKQHGHNASTLNKRGAQWIGEIVTIETAIEHGRGKAKVGDTLWSVIGPDMPEGAKAKVTDVDGTELKVEKV